LASYTIKPSDGDFSSIAGFLSDPSTINGDDADISGSWSGDDTSAITWDHSVSITNSGSKNENGYPGRSGGSYRLVIASGHVFDITADLDIRDLDIMSNSTGVSDEIFHMGGTLRNLTAKRCHIGFSGTTDQQDGVYTDSGYTGTVTFLFSGCMFFDIGRSIVDIVDSDATITINFEGCSAFRCGDQGGREYGVWVGALDVGSTPTVNINAFNCLLHADVDGSSENCIFGVNSGVAATLNVDDCITNFASGSGYTADFYYNMDTVNIGGTGYSYTWTDAAPGVGDYVAINEDDTSPYQQTLQDHANNDAKEYHSNASGSNSGLSHGTDIVGTTRTSSYCCGAHEIGEGATYTKLTDIDAILRAARTKGLDLDAILLAIQTYTKTLDLDALLKFIKTEDVDLAADIYDMLGWAWGQSNTSYVEIPEVWATWKEVGGAPATYNAEFGLLQLKSGETFYSDVKDIGSSTDRLLTIDIDKYGSGSGTQGTIEWRGSTTSFVWDAGSPSWNVYPAGGSIENWRYVQVRVTG
jgi:hypothetical protein